MWRIATGAVLVLFLAVLSGCGYQPAPVAPDPYTDSTFLGRDWPIGDGKQGEGTNIETYSGEVEMQQ
jgi:hypothetical protein